MRLLHDAFPTTEEEKEENSFLFFVALVTVCTPIPSKAPPPPQRPPPPPPPRCDVSITRQRLSPARDETPASVFILREMSPPPNRTSLYVTNYAAGCPCSTSTNNPAAPQIAATSPEGKPSTPTRSQIVGGNPISASVMVARCCCCCC